MENFPITPEEWKEIYGEKLKLSPWNIIPKPSKHNAWKLKNDKRK